MEVFNGLKFYLIQVFLFGFVSLMKTKKLPGNKYGYKVAFALLFTFWLLLP
jgi:hypothetical protein